MSESSGSGRPPAGYVGSGPNGTLSREDARRLLEEFSVSGKTFPQFTEEKGMSSSRLGWWRTKFARELREGAGGVARTGFVPVVVGRSAARNGGGQLEVILGTGQTVRVPDGFDEAALCRLVSVLEGIRRC